jgi:protein phosphatase
MEEAREVIVVLTLDGLLASDELFHFDLKNGEDEASWNIIPTIGKTPGKRYGHTLCYIKPYIVIFGGNTGTQPSNDVWIITLENSPFQWSKLELSDDSCPTPRLYHASGLCTKGTAQGMMIIFGGRDKDEGPLNDTWGLRRHRNGKWDWVPAPYKNETLPKSRYNVKIMINS